MGFADDCFRIELYVQERKSVFTLRYLVTYIFIKMSEERKDRPWTEKSHPECTSKEIGNCIYQIKSCVF